MKHKLANLTKSHLKASFGNPFIFNLCILVNEVRLNDPWEYCLYVVSGMWLIFEFFKIAMLFRGVTVGPPRVHLGEVRGACFMYIKLILIQLL